MVVEISYWGGYRYVACLAADSKPSAGVGNGLAILDETDTGKRYRWNGSAWVEGDQHILSHNGFPGGTTNFLRADGTFAAPPGGSNAFPVGAVYLSVTGVNPATELGYGTWSQIAQGQFLVGFKAADADFGTVEGVGGAKTHTHAGHAAHVFTQAVAHVFIQAAAHAAHVITQAAAHIAAATSTITGTRKGGTSGAATLTDSHAHDTPVLSHTGADVDAHSAHSGAGVDAHTGAGVDGHSAHDSPTALPPYLVVYCWKRTA